MQNAEEEELITLNEPSQIYGLNDLIYKEEVYSIIGCCMEVHKHLGKGFHEIVYKDALIYEFKEKNIPFEREKKFQINYKNAVLPHYYFSDFVLYNRIILEIKAQSNLASDHYKQVINYLAVSGNKLGLLVNFGESNLQFKRVML